MGSCSVLLLKRPQQQPHPAGDHHLHCRYENKTKWHPDRDSEETWFTFFGTEWRALPLAQDCLLIKMSVPSWPPLVLLFLGHVGFCSFPWALGKVAEPLATTFPSQFFCACGLLYPNPESTQMWMMAPSILFILLLIRDSPFHQCLWQNLSSHWCPRIINSADNVSDARRDSYGTELTLHTRKQYE